MSSKLAVYNLPPTMNQQNLSDMFMNFKGFKTATLGIDQRNQSLTAIIEFQNFEFAQLAKTFLEQQTPYPLQQCKVEFLYSEPQVKQDYYPDQSKVSLKQPAYVQMPLHQLMQPKINQPQPQIQTQTPPQYAQTIPSIPHYNPNQMMLNQVSQIPQQRKYMNQGYMDNMQMNFLDSYIKKINQQIKCKRILLLISHYVYSRSLIRPQVVFMQMVFLQMQLKERQLIFLDHIQASCLQDQSLRCLRSVENIIIVSLIMKIKFRALSPLKLFKGIVFIGKIEKDSKFLMLLQLLLLKREKETTDLALILSMKIKFNSFIHQLKIHFVQFSQTFFTHFFFIFSKFFYMQCFYQQYFCYIIKI